MTCKLPEIGVLPTVAMASADLTYLWREANKQWLVFKHNLCKIIWTCLEWKIMQKEAKKPKRFLFQLKLFVSLLFCFEWVWDNGHLAAADYQKVSNYYSVAWCGLLRYDVVCWGMMWYAVVWSALVWYGIIKWSLIIMVWYDVVWCGMMWYAVVWCGLLWYIRYYQMVSN